MLSAKIRISTLDFHFAFFYASISFSYHQIPKFTSLIHRKFHDYKFPFPRFMNQIAILGESMLVINLPRPLIFYSNMLFTYSSCQQHWISPIIGGYQAWVSRLKYSFIDLALVFSFYHVLNAFNIKFHLFNMKCSINQSHYS